MDMDSEKEIQTLETSIEELKVHVERKATLKRLMENKDFQEIVDKNYFLEEASRMLLLRDDPGLPAAKKVFLEADMHGPGAFKRYLYTIIQLGNIAEDNINQMREEIDNIHEQVAEDQGDGE